MTDITFSPIGTCRADDDGFRIELDARFAPGLAGLEGFGSVLVLWHADQIGADHPVRLVEPSPYRGGPAELGVFATRSPARPNGICVSVTAVVGVDAGRLHLAWLDCADGTPVLDIKPYQPSVDRVEHPAVPAWCAGWPASVEASADFDWDSVFGN